MQPLSQPILVGVTGAGENTDALNFALSQARTLGVGITLVHALHPTLPPPPPSVLITGDDWRDLGGRILAEAREELEQLLDGESLSVSKVVRHGHPGAVFADLSKDASMIVLQHRDLSRLHRIVTGSTVASVASHAHCPVVSVSPGRGDRSVTTRITAGLHGDGGPREVLEAAFATASNQRCSLRLIHAWHLARAYDDVVTDHAGWIADDKARITAEATEVATKYPKVTVEIDVRHDWPVDVLINAAEKADLLVVGRHGGLTLTPPRLGSITRTVVAHAASPVMIVPV